MKFVKCSKQIRKEKISYHKISILLVSENGMDQTLVRLNKQEKKCLKVPDFFQVIINCRFAGISIYLME